MTQVSDGARIMHNHVEELHRHGVIDEETVESFTERINTLQRDIERFYDEM